MSTVALHWPARSRGTRPVMRTGGVAGLLMLPLFSATVAVLTRVEWRFLHDLGWTVRHAHDVNYPSSLARGDHGAVQSLNFAALGLLTSLFARGLRPQFAHPRPGRVASAGFGAAALAGLLSAFPTDLPGEATTWHGVLHGAGFVGLLQVAFYATIVVMLAYYGVLGLRMLRLAARSPVA